MSKIDLGDKENSLDQVIEVLRDQEAEFDWDDAWDQLEKIGPKDAHQAPILKKIIRKDSEESLDDLVKLFALRALKKMEVPADDIYADALRLAKNGTEHSLRIESARVIAASSKRLDVRTTDFCSIIRANTDASPWLKLSLFWMLTRLVGGPFKAMSELTADKQKSR